MFFDLGTHSDIALTANIAPAADIDLPRDHAVISKNRVVTYRGTGYDCNISANGRHAGHKTPREYY
jgi:hypothetical protein